MFNLTEVFHIVDLQNKYISKNYYLLIFLNFYNLFVIIRKGKIMHNLIKQINKTPGSHRMGTVYGINYPQMVEILGEPNCDDDSYKVDASWCICSVDNEDNVIRIWNYKNGPNYLKEEEPDLTLDDVDEWSIWFNNAEAVNLAEILFGEYLKVERY